MSLQTPELVAGRCSNKRCLRPRPGDAGRCLSCNALLVGQLVRHRYEVKKTVGKGGFGVTYLIADRDCFNENRILKELTPRRFSQDEEIEEENVNETAERLFKREAMVLLSLKHPGIPKLYAYFSEGEYSYLVQDFIPGKTLSEEAEHRGRVYSEREAYAILLEIADILEYLHSAQPPIVHRDIKPQNLMRHEKGHLLLIDFGAVCQAVSGASTGHTLIGSPGYAPPEQIFGHPVPQSDLYAAGATILRLLTGIHPSQLFNNKQQRIDWEAKACVSKGFTDIINDLLVMDFNKRLPSAAELKRRLAELVLPESTSQQPESLAVETQPVESARQSTESESQPTFVFDESHFALSSLQPYLRKSPPDEVGDLEQTPILFLMRHFYHQRFTGLLTCFRGEDAKTIYFDQGNVTFARSTAAGERLGELLIQRGLISKTDFLNATEMMRAQSVRFGEALIELGIMTLEQLKPLIVEQISSIVHSVFGWAEGRYEVRKDILPEEQIKLSLSTADLIFEGLRKLDNMDLVKRWLGDFNRKLTTTSNPFLLYQAVNLSPNEAFIVSRIDSIMSIEGVLSLGGQTEEDTLKTICGLLAVGILEWVDGKHEQANPIAVSTLVSVPQPLPADFDLQTVQAFCYEVESMMQNIESSNHYAVLGVGRFASSFEIEEAYTVLARKFHPDRNAQLANYNLSLREELEKIFQRVLEAYTVLSNTQLRQEYDRAFRATGQIRIPTALVDVEKQHSSVPSQSTRVSLPVRAELVSSGLPLQPVPTGPPPQQPEAEPPRSQKRTTMSFPTPLPEAGSAKPSSATVARNWYQRGVEYYEAQQFRQACKAFQAATVADPKESLYRISLAKSLAQVKEYYMQAEQEFYKALELSPRNPDYFAEFGLFYQKLNMQKQAAEMFERALAIDPENALARRGKERV